MKGSEWCSLVQVANAKPTILERTSGQHSLLDISKSSPLLLPHPQNSYCIVFVSLCGLVATNPSFLWHVNKS